MIKSLVLTTFAVANATGCTEYVSIDGVTTNAECVELCNVDDISLDTVCRVESFSTVNGRVEPLGSCFDQWIYGYVPAETEGFEEGHVDNIASPAECQAICQEKEDCFQFVWTGLSAEEPAGTCFFKTEKQVEDALSVHLDGTIWPAPSTHPDWDVCNLNLDYNCQPANNFYDCLECEGDIRCAYVSHLHITGPKFCGAGDVLDECLVKATTTTTTTTTTSRPTQPPVTVAPTLPTTTVPPVQPTEEEPEDDEESASASVSFSFTLHKSDSEDVTLSSSISKTSTPEEEEDISTKSASITTTTTSTTAVPTSTTTIATTTTTTTTTPTRPAQTPPEAPDSEETLTTVSSEQSKPSQPSNPTTSESIESEKSETRESEESETRESEQTVPSKSQPSQSVPQTVETKEGSLVSEESLVSDASEEQVPGAQMAAEDQGLFHILFN